MFSKDWGIIVILINSFSNIYTSHLIIYTQKLCKLKSEPYTNVNLAWERKHKDTIYGKMTTQC